MRDDRRCEGAKPERSDIRYNWIHSSERTFQSERTFYYIVIDAASKTHKNAPFRPGNVATQPAEHNLHPQTSPLPCSPPNPTHTLLPVGGPSFATRRANRGISPLRESTRWPSPDHLCAPATAGGDGSAGVIFAIRPSQQPLLRGWGWQTAGSSPAFRQWRGARCQGWLRPPLHLRQPCPCRTWAPPA